MSENKFDCLNDTCVARLPWLRYLNLSSNALTAFPGLDIVPQLVVLDISLNELTDPPEAMWPHQKLQSLP